jgi:pSer/pThr/pTyr-binding forkhead associated (FHA) protein
MDSAERNRDPQDPKVSTIVDPEDGKVRPGGLLGSRALLVVLSENLFGRSFVLSKGRSVLGRSSGCDIVLEDPLVSREHCLIESDGEGGYQLEDLGSKNATILNRKTLTRRAPLFYGDRIVLGGTVLRFFLEERVERK